MAEDAPRELTMSTSTAMARFGGLFGALMAVFLGGMGCMVGGLAGLPLGPCALLTALFGAVLGGVVGGGISGVFYGAFMALFIEAMRKPPQLVQWEDGEAVRVFGPANHFAGVEGVGGHLYLTGTRLRFVSHGFNVQDHETSWPVGEVVDARVARSLGMFENRLILTLTDGTEETFVVEEPREWMAELAAIQLAG